MKKNYKKSTISRRKKKSRILKNKINKIIRKKKYNQKGGDAATDLGGSQVDYWRMSVPGGTGTHGNFGTLIDDVVAVVASSINTIVDTVHFVKNVMSFKSDMGSEWSHTGSPGCCNPPGM